MSFSDAGRQVKVLRENYLEPQFTELKELMNYTITLLESNMSKEQLDNIKKRFDKKNKQ
jgi:hypothetical protein